MFVKERVRHVAALDGYDLRVVSPVPYFPPIKFFPRWYPLSQYGNVEEIDGLPVHRPRYLLLPKIGKYFHPESMARSAAKTITRLQTESDFDLIDAHFVYPDGVAAMHLARRFRKPLVITGRGEDVLTCPSDPAMRKGICEALSEANRLIAVSDEIAEEMGRLGANENKITIIPNGVDVDRFQPLDSLACRRELGLPLDRRIILSVGYLLERKGFHLLVDATARLRERYPDILTVIVGGVARWGQDYSSEIKKRIADNRIADCIRMVGARPPEELPNWYAAADLFTLLTGREGCPNALLEALASGLPAVATPIGQIPSVLDSPELGVLLRDRSVPAAVDGITEAFEKSWDHNQIRMLMEKWSWRHTAQKVSKVFESLTTSGEDYSCDR